MINALNSSGYGKEAAGNAKLNRIRAEYSKDFDLHFDKMLDDIEAKKEKGVSPERLRELKRLRETAQDMEGLFIEQMLSSMRKTVGKTKFIDGGRGEEIFEDMLYEKYASQMSKSGSLGISDQIYEQMSRYV